MEWCQIQSSGYTSSWFLLGFEVLVIGLVNFVFIN